MLFNIIWECLKGHKFAYLITSMQEFLILKNRFMILHHNKILELFISLFKGKTYRIFKMVCNFWTLLHKWFKKSETQAHWSFYAKAAESWSWWLYLCAEKTLSATWMLMSDISAMWYRAKRSAPSPDADSKFSEPDKQREIKQNEQQRAIVWLLLLINREQH